MLDREFNPFILRVMRVDATEQRNTFFLVCNIFTVLERQVGKDLFDRNQLVMERASNQLPRVFQRLRIGRKRLSVSAENISRELIQQNDQRDPAPRFRFPAFEITRHGPVVMAAESILNFAVYRRAAAKPDFPHIPVPLEIRRAEPEFVNFGPIGHISSRFHTTVLSFASAVRSKPAITIIRQIVGGNISIVSTSVLRVPISGRIAFSWAWSFLMALKM